jgi:hypothetical protein
VLRARVTLSYDEAMSLGLLLARGRRRSLPDEEVRDTWADEARLMIDLILDRADT